MNYARIKFFKHKRELSVAGLSSNLKNKFNKLKTIIGEYPNLIVAYSGGVDSTLLLKVAVDVLGNHATGVIGISPSLASREYREARELANRFQLPLVEIETNEMEDENYTSNPENRCYFCKKELFTELYNYALTNKYKFIADGTNFDDVGDFRPGQQAAAELEVVSPLKEAEFTKQDVRELSKYFDLPTWDKPALACLSSRFPTGTAISPESLSQVEKAEDFLYTLGFNVVRVRHHDKLARIEVGPKEIERFLDPQIREKIHNYFRDIGYTFVTLDLRGYRQGSLNQLIPSQNQKPQTVKAE